MQHIVAQDLNFTSSAAGKDNFFTFQPSSHFFSTFLQSSSQKGEQPEYCLFSLFPNLSFVQKTIYIKKELDQIRQVHILIKM